MRFVNLPGLATGIEFFDKAIEAWKAAIERANNWSVTGSGIKWHAGETGYTLDIQAGNGGIFDAVATSVISAAPDANTLGSGTAVLRVSNGLALTNGKAITVTSNFSRQVPSGYRLAVGLGADGITYKLVGADCPSP